MGRPRKHLDGGRYSVSTDIGQMEELKKHGFGPTAVFEYGIAVVQCILARSGTAGMCEGLTKREIKLRDAARVLVEEGALEEIVEETLLRKKTEKELRGELKIENQDEESLDQPDLQGLAEIEGVLGPLLSSINAGGIYKNISAMTEAEGCVDPGMVWYDAAEALLVEATGSGDGLLDYTCDDVIAVMRRLIRDRIQAEHETLESEPLGAL